MLQDVGIGLVTDPRNEAFLLCVCAHLIFTTLISLDSKNNNNNLSFIWHLSQKILPHPHPSVIAKTWGWQIMGSQCGAD